MIIVVTMDEALDDRRHVYVALTVRDCEVLAARGPASLPDIAVDQLGVRVHVTVTDSDDTAMKALQADGIVDPQRDALIVDRRLLDAADPPSDG